MSSMLVPTVVVVEVVAVVEDGEAVEVVMVVIEGATVAGKLARTTK